jgi:hypothetical protein
LYLGDGGGVQVGCGIKIRPLLPHSHRLYRQSSPQAETRHAQRSNENEVSVQANVGFIDVKRSDRN